MSEANKWKVYTDRSGFWRMTTEDWEIPNNSVVKEYRSKKEAEHFLKKNTRQKKW